jgi:hypothetical protein
MLTLARIFGLASGFALMRYHLPPGGIIATSLVVDATLAPLTGVIAARRGRSAWLWALLGFPFGMWSLAYVLLVRPRIPASDRAYPPTSDAA